MSRLGPRAFFQNDRPTVDRPFETIVFRSAMTALDPKRNSSVSRRRFASRNRADVRRAMASSSARCFPAACALLRTLFRPPPRSHRCSSRPGCVRANSRTAPDVLVSAHGQSVPIFQQLAGGHPSGRDDVRAIPAVAAQRRGFVGPSGAPGGVGVVCRRGDRQDPADRLDPVGLTMIVDEGDHGLNRRSSSAWACVDAPWDASGFLTARTCDRMRSCVRP